MKRFHIHVFKLSQCLVAAAILLVLMIVLFTANVAVQQASTNLKTNVLPCILVDAGHGGEDGGTQSDDGVLEKEINLSIAKKVNLLLQLLGFDSKMTRTDDTLRYDESCSSMHDKKVSDIRFRYDLMKKTPNAVFLSIHQNHYREPRYHGAQVFYSENHHESIVLAQALQRSIVQTLQPDNKRTVKPCGSEVYLIYHAEMPAVMVECGFLSNRQEAAKLSDKNYQTAVSLCIVQGILDYFNHRT